MQPERRVAAGTFAYVSCPGCAARFVIVGRERTIHDAPSTIVACPECNGVPSLRLPQEITEPYRVVTRRDAMRRDD